MICTTHPKYEAKRKPQSDCLTCWIMWEAKQSKNEVQPDPQHGREPESKSRCDNCVYLEADGEIINDQIEKIMQLEARLEKSENVKPLAQYLGEYIEHEYNEDNIGESVDVLYAWDSWRELLEQALDAYESTENVLITIIKKKARK